MQFSTPVSVSKSNHPIDYLSSIVAFGSCFAENMGEKFSYFKFQNTVNPFGIIFNPVSIEKLLERVVNQSLFTEKDIFFHNDLWHCYEVHSELSNASKEELLNNLNALLSSTHSQIAKATHIIITYGTSWVYRNKETNAIVANCHKVPQNQFNKEILSIATIEQSIQNTIDLVHQLNPSCHFIFTISPVRHSKDGFVENQRIKAHLISAIHHSKFTIHNYFPSYEIMMDELRDYRFYANDMLHPSEQAIDFIWIKFFENYVAQKEFQTMQQVCDIQKALAHRPFNVGTESHQKFIDNTNKKIAALKQQHPNISF